MSESPVTPNDGLVHNLRLCSAAVANGHVSVRLMDAADRIEALEQEKRELAKLCWRQGQEIQRLRGWVRCPEHGPNCGGDDCCCTDKHQAALADGVSTTRASAWFNQHGDAT